MNLLRGVEERLAEVGLNGDGTAQRPIVPIAADVGRCAARIHLVEDSESAARILDLLARIPPPAAIGVDSEYRFGQPAIELRRGGEWRDVRSQVPICFSIAVWCTSGSPGGTIVRAILDVRVPAVVAALREVLRLRVPFVFHHVKAELFSLWALGIDVPIPSLYDTYLAAACLNLGSHHRRATKTVATTQSEQIELDEDLDERRAGLLSLIGQCDHYGLSYPYSRETKNRFRDRFLALRDDEPLVPDLVDYAIADADRTLRVYIAQQVDVLRQGIHAHLHTIEFPFAVANARMEWNGVQIDQAQMARLRVGAKRAADYYAAELIRLGVDPPGSRDKLVARLKRVGLGGHLKRDSEFSTKDEVLEPIEHLDPAIRATRRYRKFSRLASEEWLTGMLIGADGRTHPEHRQLGAATGRNSCTTPNIAGIGRMLRPIVEAPPGFALLELDYAQIEVGVAGAEYGDPDLVAAYNSGDVYAAMAKRFYADELPPADIEMSAAEFKKRHAAFRDRMKVFVLATLYGITVDSLAKRFKISLAAAQSEHDRFLGLFPVLRDRLHDQEILGPFRGDAIVVSGLRRRVERRGRPSTWVRNLMRNTPIQGSAAIVFKRAVIDLDREFLGTNVKLVMPVHDAIVIECPRDRMDDVATRSERIMLAALRTFYPQLSGKVDVNKSAPDCWNKDGRADSLERFLSDPEFSLEVPEREDGLQISPESHRIEQPVLDWATGYERRSSASQLLDAFERQGGRLRPYWIEDSSDAFALASDRYEERAALLDFDGEVTRFAEAVASVDVAAIAPAEGQPATRAERGVFR